MKDVDMVFGFINEIIVLSPKTIIVECECTLHEVVCCDFVLETQKLTPPRQLITFYSKTNSFCQEKTKMHSSVTENKYSMLFN